MIHDDLVMLSGMHTDRSTIVTAVRSELFYAITPTEAGKRPKQLRFRTTGTAGTCTFQITMKLLNGTEVALITSNVVMSRTSSSYIIVNNTPLVLNAVLLFDVTSVSSTNPPTGLAFNFVIG